MYRERLLLEDRVAVVFGGAGGGMGTQTALAVVDAGAKLVAVDINEERVKETERQVTELGGTCIGIGADVRELDELRGVYERAVQEFGGVDCVVNLVGGMRLVTRTAADTPVTGVRSGSTPKGGGWLGIDDYPDDVYDDLITLNMTYAFNSCREAARIMLRQGRGGSIVNFASVSALAAAPYHIPYGMAKAGVMSLTRSVAVELGPSGVRCNCVVPGSVPAPLAQNSYPAAFDDITDRASRKSPLGRRVAPEEIAGAALFLLSDLSGGITGQCLNVDAGASANCPLGTGLEYQQTTALRQ